ALFGLCCDGYRFAPPILRTATISIVIPAEAGIQYSPACRSHNRRGVLGVPRPSAQLRTRRGTTGVVVAGLKPQHRLGDDVALDLVGAAVDRDLAVVEVARRDLGGPVHGLVRAVVTMHVVGRGERAD